MVSVIATSQGVDFTLAEGCFGCTLNLVITGTTRDGIIAAVSNEQLRISVTDKSVGDRVSGSGKTRSHNEPLHIVRKNIARDIDQD